MTKFSEPSSVDITTLDIHPEANITPRMTTEQYNALKLDIEKNGQLEPIVLYRGRIIDGRHRYCIMSELGIKTVVVVSISNNSTIMDIRTIVKSKEIHRHQTPTQLAIYAYRQMISYNSDSRNKDSVMTQSDAAREFGVVVKQIGRVARIDNKLMRPDIIDMLFTGNKFNIGSSIMPNYTNNLRTINSYLKEDRMSRLGKPKDFKYTESENEFINDSMIELVNKCGIDDSIEIAKRILAKYIGKQ